MPNNTRTGFSSRQTGKLAGRQAGARTSEAPLVMRLLQMTVSLSTHCSSPVYTSSVFCGQKRAPSSIQSGRTHKPRVSNTRQVQRGRSRRGGQERERSLYTLTHTLTLIHSHSHTYTHIHTHTYIHTSRMTTRSTFLHGDGTPGMFFAGRTLANSWKCLRNTWFPLV